MDEIEKRKEKIKIKIKSLIKDKHTLIFFGIMIFAIIIRLYYFVLTKNQPLWWDESDYMAYAKDLAGFNVNWLVSSEHNSLFIYIVAGLMKLGISEAPIKFLLVVLPSILLVFLTYKICILIYKDKRIALISSFLIAIFWNILFNSFRFHVDVPALFFSFLAIYVFFQGYERKEKIFGKINPNWALLITAILTIISYSFRRAYILFGLFFLIYLISTKDIKQLIKNKYNWIALGGTLSLFFIIEKYLFISSITSVAKTYAHLDRAINFDTLGIFNIYLNNFNGFSWLIYLFYLGLILIIFNSIISFDYIRKKKWYETKGDLFILLSILITLSYFIFYQRDTIGDPRWYLPLILGTFVCISKGTLFITDHLSKYSKLLSVILLIFLIGLGGYAQLQHSDQIIKSKIPSFNGIRQAGIYLEEISNVNDIIISVPVPQLKYYSEREVLEPWRFMNESSNQATTLEDFLFRLNENENVQYLIVTFSEPNHPFWMRQDGNGIIQIPFMETTIDLVNGQHDIKTIKKYGDITFNLITIKDDAFVYEIQRKWE